MPHTKAAVRVGAVVLLGIALLLAVLYFFENRRGLNGGYPLEVTFMDAQGIKKGADVRLAGVTVGTVQDIGVIDSGRRALLRMMIANKTAIPAHSDYTITSGGLLGELFVQITPPQHLARAFVRQDAASPERITGTDLPSIDALKTQVAQLSQGSQKVVKNLQVATEGFAKITGDPAVQRALRSTILNADALSNAGVGATHKVDALLANLNATVNRETPLLDQAARNLAAATGQVGPVTQNANQVLRNANKLVKNLDDTLSSLRGVVETTNPGESLHNILANLNKATVQLNEIAANANKISADLATGTTPNSTKLGEVVDNVRDATANAAAILGRFTKRKPTGKGAGTGTGAATGTGGGKSPLRFITQFDAYENLNRGPNFRVDANAIIPRGPDFYLLGIRDIGEANTLNLQKGSLVSPQLSFRYGFHAGKLGVGADYGLTGATSLSAEFYQPRTPRLDLYGRRQINSQLGVAVGFEDVLHRSKPTVGLTYRP